VGGVGLHPILIGLTTANVAFFATSLYLHRSLAHRSVDFSSSLAFGFRLAIWLLTGINRRQWVAVHRRHHAVADTDGDPHGPAQFGYWTIQFLSILPYRRASRDQSVYPRLTRGVDADHLDSLFDHGWLGVTTMLAVGAIMTTPRDLLVVALTHVFSYFTLQGLVNALCHTSLRRTASPPWVEISFAPTNRRLVALFTLGEGLHANHHYLQASARLSVRRGEVDLGWAAIVALEHLGLAQVRRPRPSACQASHVSG